MEYEKLTLLLQLVNVIVLPLGYYLFKYLKQWRDDNKLRDEHNKLERELLKVLIMALTQDKIYQSGEFFLRLNAIPAKIKDRLLEIGYAYLQLHGDEADKDFVNMIEKIRRLKVDDDVLKRLHEVQYKDIDLKKV